MSTFNKPAQNENAAKRTVKPVGRLDASMLFARKGEAAPAMAATTQNNPGLAWGAPAVPADLHHAQAMERAPSHHPQPSQNHAAASLTGAVEAPAPVKTPSAKPTASARLRPESFLSTHGRGGFAARSRKSPVERDPVALTVRMEDDTYLRLKYLAQSLGRSTQQILGEALDKHLSHEGVPQTRKLVVKPEE